MASLAVKAYWNAFTLWHARGERELPFQPLDRITRLRDRRVRAIVEHAFRRVPYYRDTMARLGLLPSDFQTAADLAQLPMIDGRSVANEPQRFLADTYSPSSGLAIDSSGTSGRSKKIHYDARALFLSLAKGRRQRDVISKFSGSLFGCIELSLVRPGGVHTQIRRFYEANSWAPRAIDLKRALAPPGELTVAETAESINRLEPAIIRGYGSYVGALFREIRRQGLSVHRPRLVMYGADLMPESDRLLIEEDFGIPVWSSYQAVEALRIGFQCEERRGFHLHLDAVDVRIADDRGETVASGESGHVVISNLTNRATVLLNYKLGDVATIAPDACPCGRTLPTLERIRGRSDDLLYLPDGRIMHGLLALEPLRAAPGVQQIQIVQRSRDSFLLRVVPRPGEGLSRDSIAQIFRSKITDSAVVEVEELSVIPAGSNGKVRAVVNQMDRDER